MDHDNCIFHSDLVTRDIGEDLSTLQGGEGKVQLLRPRPTALSVASVVRAHRGVQIEKDIATGKFRVVCCYTEGICYVTSSLYLFNLVCT